MASGPLKSQPLHNFSLPHLKWGKNQMNNQRCRKPSAEPHLDDHHPSSASEPESDTPVGERDKDHHIGSRSSSSKKKQQQTMMVASKSVQNHETEAMVVMDESETEREGRGNNNLFIRYRKSITQSKDEGKKQKDEVDESSAGQKPWNLRPRKSLMKPKPSNEIGRGGGAGGGAGAGGGGGGESHCHHHTPKKNPNPTEVEERPGGNHPPPKSLRLRGFAEAAAAANNVVEKKEKKRKFSVELSRDEIEEDFFVLTGFKPPRRPKKRAKNIQKQLENVFPGLWLAEITAESYNVPEVPLKR